MSYIPLKSPLGLVPRDSEVSNQQVDSSLIAGAIYGQVINGQGSSLPSVTVPPAQAGSVATTGGMLAIDPRTNMLLESNTLTKRFVPVSSRPFFKLLIYYGYPSLVNAASNINQAAQIYSEYDLVVFGAGLEVPTHPDHANLVTIIRLMNRLNPQTLVAGYIDLGVTTNNYTIAQMTTMTSQWKATGADMIFWDDAGYDFHTDRARQTTMINVARSLGMASFMNAFNPDDIFSTTVGPYNPLGSRSVLGPDDWFLLESWPYNQGVYPGAGFLDRATVVSRANTALNWRTQFGTKIAAVSTVQYPANINSYNQYIRNLVQAMGFIFGFDAYNDNAFNFSAFGPETNLVFKGDYDMKMAQYQFAYPIAYTDNGTTFSRNDYNTVVYYVDATQYALNTPVSVAPLSPQGVPSGVPPAGLVGRIAFNPSNVYGYDNGAAWVNV